MRLEGNHLIADEGKVLRRIGTDDVYGGDIYLGYSHYIGGIRQLPPHLDLPEDFEEIDASPEEELEEQFEEINEF